LRNWHQSIHASLDDADSLVARARTCLTEHRRSVAWWTKAYELNCKIAEFRVTTDCILAVRQGKVDDKLPSIRAAVDRTSEVVLDAIRVINVDVLQCARILESVTNHLKWVAVTFGQVSGADASAFRGDKSCFKRLKDRCEILIDVIGGAIEKRNEMTDKYSLGRSKLDLEKNVSAYVKRVRLYSRAFCATEEFRTIAE
jgi:hypothetical protein